MLYSCTIIHAGLFADRFEDFYSAFVASCYLVVQTSTSAGYGDLSKVFETRFQLLMIFVLITSIMFFGFFVSRFKAILDRLTVSFRALVLQERDNIEEWLSVRQKDAEKRDEAVGPPSAVLRKLLHTYRSYITHNFAAVHRSDFFDKLGSREQQAVTENRLTAFMQTFSYLTKTLGVAAMKRLFGASASRM